MRIATTTILLTCLAWAGPARANDLELFDGLIPGEPLNQEEMGEVFGRGSWNFQLVDGSLVSLDGASVSQNQNQTSTVSQTSGITTSVPVIGDNNTVSLEVNVIVNLNTVTVLDSAGSSVNVNQSLDFGGGLIQALGR